MGQQRQTSDLLDTAERRQMVLSLRRAGMGYHHAAAEVERRIGKERLPAGWDARYAYKDVQRELERVRAEVEETAQEIRQIELDRLDEMLKGLWIRARRGDEKAVDRVLKIIERRCKMLGIDAPDRVEHSGGLLVRGVDFGHPRPEDIG